jgi:hypothetical protein
MDSFLLIKPDETITEYVFQKYSRVGSFLSTKRRVHFCNTCHMDEKELDSKSYDIYTSADLINLMELLNTAESIVHITTSYVSVDVSKQNHFIFVHV